MIFFANGKVYVLLFNQAPFHIAFLTATSFLTVFDYRNIIFKYPNTGHILMNGRNTHCKAKVRKGLNLLGFMVISKRLSYEGNGSVAVIRLDTQALPGTDRKHKLRGIPSLL